MHKIGLEIFIRYNGLTISQPLQKALTHNSYNELNNNSKYVFLGMYAFKGRVCECIYKNIQGTGTQLQQYFGEVTSQKYYAHLFDYLQLQKNVKYANNIKIEEQKHIFMAGLLGYIFNNVDDQQLQKTIYRFFIAPNDSLLPKNFYVNDPWQQLMLLSKQNDLPKPKRTINITANKTYTCTINFGANEVVEHTSVSYLYAQKKAVKMALKSVVNKLAAVLAATPQHTLVNAIINDNILKQVAKKQQEKQTIIAKKQMVRNQKKIVVKKQIEEKALKKNLALKKKRLTQKNKVTKTRDTIYRSYTEEEIKAMSVSKRRNLQDRGII